MRIGFVYGEILAFASVHPVGTLFLASRNRVLPSAREAGRKAGGLARVTNTRPSSSVQCLGLAGTWEQYHDHVFQFSSLSKYREIIAPSKE
jgi:hypothetical protein